MNDQIPPGEREDKRVDCDVDLDRVWLGVASEAWRRTPGRLERRAARVLGSRGLARALTATPSLLLGWLIATLMVLVVGAAATLSTGTPLVPLLAPALAGVGIAYAYGPGVDPAYELTRSVAISDRMVLLVRALAVFGVNAILGVAAAAASGTAAAITFGWLVPMTAVCAVALAVATVTRSAHVGVAAGVTGWTITVLAGVAGGGSAATAVTDTTLFLPYLAVALIGVGTVLYSTRTLKGSS